MKLAAVKAIAGLARTEAPPFVLEAYGLKSLSFGRDYILPKPFDPRLLSAVSPAVAQSAMESGEAQKKIDMSRYAADLLKKSEQLTISC
jgi:malate dehydrogenase (oxaloacetate-decarboxylating)(NADP+)